MDIAPVGCMIADTTKGVQYVNETWWQLSQHARVPLDQIDWNTVLHEEDLDIAEEGWQVSKLMHDLPPHSNINLGHAAR